MTEESRETEDRPPEERSGKGGEPSGPDGVQESGRHRRAEPSAASPPEEQRHEERPAKRPGGRPHKRWKIRVVRIDASKYPQYAQDKDHPFAKMVVEARLEEIDVFLARLRARKQRPASGGWSVAA